MEESRVQEDRVVETTLPLLWNQLDAIKLQHNKTTFKIALRGKLLSE
jgi:hypothetical protein